MRQADFGATTNSVVEGGVNLRISTRSHTQSYDTLYPLRKRVSCSHYLDARLLWQPHRKSRKLLCIPRKESIGLSVSDGEHNSYSSLLTLVASSLRCRSWSYKDGRTIQDCQLGYSAYPHPYGLPLVNCSDLEEKQSQRYGLPGLFSVPRFLRDRPTYISILCWLVALISSLCGIP